MLVSLQSLFAVIVAAFASASGRNDHCAAGVENEGSRCYADSRPLDESREAGYPSLLQRSRGIDRGPIPQDSAPQPMAARAPGVKDAQPPAAVYAAANNDQDDERGEIIAMQAPLDTAGYKQVASLKSHRAMEAYIRRVVGNNGCRVSDESQLQGVIPFYSGESAVQTYAALEAEIYKACTGTGTWLTSLYPKSVLTGQDSTLDAVHSTLGSTAKLTEPGFQEVVRLKDDVQMLKYARRVVSMLHGWVVDESGLHGLLPFFTGEKSVQTLGALILEIESAMQKTDGWVMKAPSSMRHLAKPGALLQASGDPSDADAEEVPATPIDEEAEEEVALRLNEVASRNAKGAGHAFEECPEDDLEEITSLNNTAWSVPLDEKGYEALTQLKSDCAMMQFVVRVIHEIHCHTVDQSGLKGMVPFYSGTQAKQDLEELRVELKGTCNMEGKWLVPDVKYWANTVEGRASPAALLAKPSAQKAQAQELPKPVALIAVEHASSATSNSWACRAFGMFCSSVKKNAKRSAEREKLLLAQVKSKPSRGKHSGHHKKSS